MPNTNLGKVSVTPRGEYQESAKYKRLDIVAYGGGSYMALRDVSGVTPTEGNDWMRIASVGATGDTGATFTPGVDEDGNIKWTNDKGLGNPPPANIRGPKGDTGPGLRILGYYDSAAALQSAVTNPQAGDAYGVGTAEPYSIYIWDALGGRWVNNGVIGPAGSIGVYDKDDDQEYSLRLTVEDGHLVTYFERVTN